MDLADLSSVRDWAKRAQDFSEPLDVLICNAGECLLAFRGMQQYPGGWRSRGCVAACSQCQPLVKRRHNAYLQ